jgi:hypothetical protein
MRAVANDPPFSTFNLSLRRQEEPVRVRILIAAAVVTGGWLAACSKPAPEVSGSARQIRLAEPPASDSAIVSNLEANKAVKATLVRRSAPPSAEPVERAPGAAAPVEVGAASDVAATPVPEMRMTTSLVAKAPLLEGMRPMPVIPLIGSGHDERMGRGRDEPGFQSDRSRGPMILIRGGMGGVDDKCDLRGGHRGGIAINRSAPSFGGYPRGGGIR